NDVTDKMHVLLLDRTDALMGWVRRQPSWWRWPVSSNATNGIGSTLNFRCGYEHRPGILANGTATADWDRGGFGGARREGTMSSPTITCDVHLDGPALNRRSIESLDGGFGLRL